MKNTTTAKLQAAELLGQVADLLSQAEKLLYEADLLDEWTDEDEEDQVGNLLELASDSLQRVVDFCQ